MYLTVIYIYLYNFIPEDPKHCLRKCSGWQTIVNNSWGPRPLWATLWKITVFMICYVLGFCHVSTQIGWVCFYLGRKSPWPPLTLPSSDGFIKLNTALFWILAGISVRKGGDLTLVGQPWMDRGWWGRNLRVYLISNINTIQASGPVYHRTVAIYSKLCIFEAAQHCLTLPIKSSVWNEWNFRQLIPEMGMAGLLQ